MGGAAAVNSYASATSDLQAILAGRNTRFYNRHLIRLSCILFLLLITSATNGYDGSMMNGLQ